MAWIIYIFLISLSPWIIVPYSDSLALGVVTLETFLLYFIIVLITIIISFCIVKCIINNGGYNRNKEMKFVISHFLMMGWNEQSGEIWNREDVQFSLSFDNYNERNKANLQKFKIRIKNMKLKGINKQIVKKILTNYNEGTFAYGKEGEFYLEDYKTGNKQLREILENIYKEQGEYLYILLLYV